MEKVATKSGGINASQPDRDHWKGRSEAVESPEGSQRTNSAWIVPGIVGGICIVANLTIFSWFQDELVEAWRWPIPINITLSFCSLAAPMLILGGIQQSKLLSVSRIPSAAEKDLRSIPEISSSPVNALLVIASLLLSMHALASHIVSFSTRLAYVEGKASILQTQIYNTELPMMSYYGRAAWTDLGMRGAIYSGIYNSPSEPVFRCPSNKCTWESFSTLGICSTCTDVSGQTLRSCTSTQRPSTCEYTTPRDIRLAAHFGRCYDDTTDTIVNSSATGQIGSWPADSTIATITTLRYPWKDRSCEIPKAEVNECRFFWCARTYRNTTSMNGVLHSSDIAKTNLSFVTGSLPYFIWKAPHDQKPDDMFNDTFYVQIQDGYNTGLFLAGLFNVELFQYATSGPDQEAASAALAVYRASSIPELMQNISDSMTNRIRNSKDRIEFPGSSLEDIHVFQISWLWMIFPSLAVMMVYFAIWCTTSTTPQDVANKE